MCTPGVEQEAAAEGDDNEDDGEVELEFLILVFVSKPGKARDRHPHSWVGMQGWGLPSPPCPEVTGQPGEVDPEPQDHTKPSQR